jgi:succinyl-CoA synthetase beta subunit
MARLHEFQGKALLKQHGFSVPRGGAATSARQAREIAQSIGFPVVIKIQAWTTGRAGIGGIAFAETPDQAAEHAARLLGMRVGQFDVTHVLIEEKLSISSEIFLSLSIDDGQRCPVMLLSFAGGSGIEQRGAEVHRILCDVRDGPGAELARIVNAAPLAAPVLGKLIDTAHAAFKAMRAFEARFLEINPLGILSDGRLLAVDCRITVDDYAVFRHPELGIEIARELDHPPTELEHIAYRIEQEDHRGTFYFAQLAKAPAPNSRGLIGFHGAGGGGSMMSMDAVTNENFTIANFTDTSGNPSAAKVYRAARTILSQPGLVGYFGSGSGVASQEQFWSAYGLAKAFWEMNLDIPAVIRLGGNSEDRAVQILEAACRGLPARVEGYKKTDSPAKIAARFAELVNAGGKHAWQPRKRRVPEFVAAPLSISFAIKGGRLWIDAARWSQISDVVLKNASGLLRDDNGAPALSVAEAELAGKDSEMIACEVESRIAGVSGVFVDLEIPGIDVEIARDTRGAPESSG